MPIAYDIKSQIEPFGITNPRIDLVFQPVLGNLALHGLYVPRIQASKISTASGKSKTTFCIAGGHRIRAANRPTFAVRNLIRLRLFRLRLSFRRSLYRSWFLYLYILI